MQVEDRILGGLGTRPGPRPLAERVGAGFRLTLLQLYLRAGARIQVPTRAILPAGGVSLDQLRTRWDRVRTRLTEALERFEPADLARPMMKHPIVGKLTPTLTLAFIEHHAIHHRRQLDRIRTAPGFPG